MKTLEKVKSEILALAEERVNIEKTGFFQLWQLQNDKVRVKFDYLISEYVKKQKEMGFSEDDLKVKAYISTHNAWFSWIGATVSNPKNGTDVGSGAVEWQNRKNFTKAELEEADAPLVVLIEQNRKQFIGNKDACIEFINSGKFYQNNLNQMNFDQETQDFVLSVKKEMEEQKAAAEKAAREALNAWATKNGSDLLKLRIKHEQNWMHLAQTEWALAHSTGFNVWDQPEDDDNWPVNNATIDQLEALETAEAENPDHNIEIFRYKWVEDYGEVTHRTFLTCDVKTPTGNITLYKEIEDASSDDDE